MAKLKLPKKEVSYWTDSTSDPKYPRLAKDLSTDVLIVGGGLAGLNAAYLLKQAGKKVVVLEKSTIGSGVTGHTTGKVTSQHNLIYSKLQEHLGKKKAADYGEANQEALKLIKKIIQKEKIQCDWQDDDNYVVTEKEDTVEKLEQEAKIAKSLGLPATFVTKTDLPFKIQGAVKFSGQGKMHARKYALGLAKAINGNGSYVFENTEVKSVDDGDEVKVSTEKVAITAKDAIIATNVPFPYLTHAAYGVHEYPMKSYIVAARIKQEVKGMYITPGGPLYSILPIKSGKDNLLLIGGQSHFPGLGGSSSLHYQKLADFAQERFGVTSIDYRWSAWDYLSYDKVPLVGKAFPWSKHVYVSTAFMKWGLTNTAACGMILCDLITGNKNKWANTFSSTRSSTISSIPRFTIESATAIPGFIGSSFSR